MTIDASCTVTGLNLISSSSSSTCSTANNSITITNALTSDYSYSSLTYISFKVGLITLPFSSQPVGNITFETYTADINGNYQLVENSSISGLFSCTPGLLSYGNVSGLSQVAFEVTSYTVEFSITDPIDKGGYVVIILPS